MFLASAALGCSAEDLDDFFGDGGLEPELGDAGAQPPAPAGCNTVSLDGALVTPRMHSGTLVFYGGTPGSGTYRLVKTEVTTGSSPRPERRTIVISGDVFEFASGSSDGTVSRWSATFRTVNVDMTTTRTCGTAGAMQTYKYTAAGSTLAILSGSILYTYQR